MADRLRNVLAVEILNNSKVDEMEGNEDSNKKTVRELK